MARAVARYCTNLKPVEISSGEGGGVSGIMPSDDTRIIDDDEAGGGRRVGGKAHARYESEEEEEMGEGGGAGEQSLQSAIDRQAEAIVLGQMLLNPAKRRQIEDAAYNRHTRNDRGLPQWFIDDERKFAQPSGYGVSLDDGMVDKARNGLKDITARTIGKVAEAKARKQRRTQRALTKLRKKANAVANKEDLSEREKAREVEKLYKKKIDTKERKKKTLIVGKKSSAGASGKMGHGIKMVDSRLRKDARAEKRAAKNSKKGHKGKHGGVGGNGRKGGRQKKGSNYGRK